MKLDSKIDGIWKFTYTDVNEIFDTGSGIFEKDVVHLWYFTF